MTESLKKAEKGILSKGEKWGLKICGCLGLLSPWYVLGNMPINMEKIYLVFVMTSVGFVVIAVIKMAKKIDFLAERLNKD